jgi:prepilin-type N-terminal cleavage/methylation domain-containing protein
MRPIERRGFTLLELLVAVTITLLLAGLMLTVVTNTLNLWQRTQNNFTGNSQAALALDLIERDLQAAVFRKDNLTWLAVDVLNAPTSLTTHGWLTPVTMKPGTGVSQRLLPDTDDGSAPAISGARFGLSGAWWRFITTNVETNGSLPVAVSYQIARRPVSGSVAATNPAEVRYTLFRSVVSVGNTFATGNDVTVSGYGSTSTTPLASRNPKTLTNPNSQDALATNVVDFGVWLYVRDETTGGLRRIYPADNSDLSHSARDAGSAADANRFPAVAEVLVRILSDQGATLLGEIESGGGHLVRPPEYVTDADWWWGMVEMHSRVYVRRVAIKGIAQ